MRRHHLVALVGLALSLPAMAGVPNFLPLQGALRGAGGEPAPDGAYGLTLRLFDAEVDGELLFEESLGAADQVVVSDGVFSTRLGGTKPLPPGVFGAASEVWLEVQVELDPPLPRKRLGAVAYALHAGHAATADAVVGSAPDLACSGCVGEDELDFDPATQAELDGAVASLADLYASKSSVYTKAEVDGLIAAIPDPPDPILPPNLATIQSKAGEELTSVEPGQTVVLVGTGFGANPSVRLMNQAFTPTGPSTATTIETVLSPVPTDTLLAISVVDPATGLRSNAVTIRALSSDFGDGSDGSLTVAGTTAIDSVRTPLTADAPSGAKALGVASSVGFGTGDMVLVITLQGPGAGLWETGFVESVAGDVIQLSAPLEKSYQAAAKAVVQRIPQYSDVNVGAAGTLTAGPWDGTSGGVVAIAVSGTLTVEAGGAITASGLGFRGGSGGSGVGASAHQGESFAGTGAVSTAANGGGGGGGKGEGDACNPGGGGSYGTAGGQGTGGKGSVTAAGNTYGDPGMVQLMLGSGGGGGGTDSEGDGAGSTGGAGGRGGGIVLVLAKSVVAGAPATAVESRGQKGGTADPGPQVGETGAGAGGSGGGVYVLTAGGPAGLIPAVTGGGPGTPNFNGGSCPAAVTPGGGGGRYVVTSP